MLAIAHSGPASARPNTKRVFVSCVLALVYLTVAPAEARNYVYHTPLWQLSPGDSSGHNAIGLAPIGELIQLPDGTFFGAMATGGPNGSGTVFKFDRGSQPRAIYSFSAVQGDPRNSIPTNSDGANPGGGLTLGTDGFLYGVTSGGGANGTGTIFRITTDGTLTTLHTFDAVDSAMHNNDGNIPYGKLIQARDGNFYGTARFGGPAAQGTIYRMAPDGTFTLLHAFAALDGQNKNAEGAAAVTGLLQATDGNLYGVAESGGIDGAGTIFKLTLQGSFSVFHSLANHVGALSEGAFPGTALMQASNGYLYGTTRAAGIAGYGSIYRISLAGAFDIVHAFDPVLAHGIFETQTPVGRLLEGPDGTLYGVGGSGGAANLGTIFTLSPTGEYSLQFSFGSLTPGGAGPSGGLIIGNDGSLYGLTTGQPLAAFPFESAGTAFVLTTTATPPISLTVDPDTVVLGNPFTVSWSSPSGGDCSGLNGYLPNSIGASGSVINNVGEYGLIAYFLACGTPQGQATTVAIENVLPPLPTISVSATPNTFSLGNVVTIDWSSSYSFDCAASGAWTGARETAGNEQETPTATGVRTYTLTCNGPGGTSTASATVNVTAAAPPTVAISASPSSITAGATAPILSWTATGARDCTANGAWSGVQPLVGNLSLSNLQAGSYTYNLSCTGPGGTTTASATLTVTAASTGGGGGGATDFVSLLLLGAILMWQGRKMRLPAWRKTKHPAGATSNLLAYGCRPREM